MRRADVARKRHRDAQDSANTITSSLIEPSTLKSAQKRASGLANYFETVRILPHGPPND